MYKVSVITPCYKGKKYISSLIDQISKNADCLTKKYPDSYVEMILINDYPEDDLSISEKPNNIEITLIQHGENLGIHQSRVDGWKAAKGDYIIFLDQDDKLSYDCILNEIEHIGDADWLLSNAKIEDCDGNVLKLYNTKGKLKNALNINLYIKSHNQITSPGQCMIKKNAIPYEWTSMIMKTNGSDDLFLWMLLLAKKQKAVVYDKVFYTHTFTGENLSEQEEKMAKSSLEAAEYLKKCDCFTKYQINSFIRSRRIKSNGSHYNKITKIMFMIINLDIFLPKIWWKLKEKIEK